jgi:hypothetical protein
MHVLILHAVYGNIFPTIISNFQGNTIEDFVVKEYLPPFI